MESRLRKLLVVTALIPAAAHAQPAEPPAPAPAPPAPAPPAPPPPAPPPAEATPPPAPVTPGDACRARRHEMEDQAAHTADLNERARILQSLPDCAHAESAPPPVPVEAGTTAAPAPAVEAATGVALELGVDTSFEQLGSNSVISLPQAGIFLGYRTPALTIGLGFDFGRVGTSMDNGTSSSDESSTTFLLMPGVRAHLAHSADGRTELLGRIDAGYGQISPNSSGGSDVPSVGHIRVQVAPDLRFWVTRSFGVGAAVGLRYDRLSQDTSGGGVSSSTSQSTTALFSSFHLVGVF